MQNGLNSQEVVKKGNLYNKSVVDIVINSIYPKTKRLIFQNEVYII